MQLFYFFFVSFNGFVLGRRETQMNNDSNMKQPQSKEP